MATTNTHPEDFDCDVAIAGAGPVGLFLAGLLSRIGLAVTILERLDAQSHALKAGAINGRSTQLLSRLGLQDALDREAAKSGTRQSAFTREKNADPNDSKKNSRFDGHFGGIFLRASSALEVPVGTILPQQALEVVLRDWAVQLGTRIVRNHEVVALTQDRDSVTLAVNTENGQQTRRCRFLVGCDGGRSSVRKLTGFDFPGTEPTTTGHQAIVTLDKPDALKPGWNTTPNGMYLYGKLPSRFLTVEFNGSPLDRTLEVTKEDLETSLRRVSGCDVNILSVEQWARFTDNIRQASTYRIGRVLLAGDAAHIHPPYGGQGLNLGLQDAANLGWKLAASVQGWAPEGLLDSYTTERHPVGAQVLSNTRAQIALMRPDSSSRALREVFEALLQNSAINDRLISMLQGLDICYSDDLPEHPCVGTFFTFAPGISDYTLGSKAVLFERQDSVAYRALALAWADRLEFRVAEIGCPFSGLLMRPDGYIAWASAEYPSPKYASGLKHALTHWFGQPCLDDLKK